MKVTEAQQSAEPTREAIIEAARDIMVAAGPGALITIGPDGSPQARMMDAFPPEPDLTVWMGTNRGTRKVDEIRANPEVTLIYFDPANPGYATLVGTARLVEDPGEKRARFKEAWAGFYPDGAEDSDYLLIEFRPRRVEVVSVKHSIASDPLAWKPAIAEFGRRAQPVDRFVQASGEPLQVAAYVENACVARAGHEATVGQGLEPALCGWAVERFDGEVLCGEPGVEVA